MSATERIQKVVKCHSRLSLVQQCKILNIHRTGLYHKPKLMKEIDAYFLEHHLNGV